MRYNKYKLILSAFFLSVKVFTGSEGVKSPEELVGISCETLEEKIARAHQQAKSMSNEELQGIISSMVWSKSRRPEDSGNAVEMMYISAKEYNTREIQDKWAFLKKGFFPIGSGYRPSDLIEAMLGEEDFFDRDRIDIIGVLLKEIDEKDPDDSKFMFEFWPQTIAKLIKYMLLGKIFPDGYKNHEQVMEILSDDMQIFFDYLPTLCPNWESKWQWLTQADFEAILEKVTSHKIYDRALKHSAPKEKDIQDFPTNWHGTWARIFREFAKELQGRLNQKTESIRELKGKQKKKMACEIESTKKLIENFNNACLCIEKVVGFKKEMKKQRQIDKFIIDGEYDKAISKIKEKLELIGLAQDITPALLGGIDSNRQRRRIANDLNHRSKFALSWWNNLLVICESAQSINNWLEQIRCTEDPQKLMVINCLIITTAQKLEPILNNFGNLSDGHSAYAQNLKNYYHKIGIGSQIEVLSLRYGNDEKLKRLVTKLMKLSLDRPEMLKTIHDSELPQGLTKDNIVSIVELLKLLKEENKAPTDHEEISEVSTEEPDSQSESEVSDSEPDEWDLDAAVRYIEGENEPVKAGGAAIPAVVVQEEAVAVVTQSESEVPYSEPEPVKAGGVAVPVVARKPQKSINWTAYTAGNMLKKCLKDRFDEGASIEGELPRHLEFLRLKEGLSLAILYQIRKNNSKESIQHSQELLAMFEQAGTSVIKSEETHAKCVMLGLIEFYMSTSNWESYPKHDITVKESPAEEGGINISYGSKQVLLAEVVILAARLSERDDLGERRAIIEEITQIIRNTLKHILDHNKPYSKFLTNYLMERFTKALQDVKSYSKAWDFVMDFNKTIVNQIPHSQESKIELYFHRTSTCKNLGTFRNQPSIRTLLTKPEDGVRTCMIMPKKLMVNLNAIYEVNVAITGKDLLGLLSNYLDHNVEHLYFFSAVVPSREFRAIIDRAKHLQIRINTKQDDLDDDQSAWINSKERLGELRKIPLCHGKGFISIKKIAGGKIEVVTWTTSSNFSFGSLQQGFLVESIVATKKIYKNMREAMKFMQEFIDSYEQA